MVQLNYKNSQLGELGELEFYVLKQNFEDLQDNEELFIENLYEEYFSMPVEIKNSQFYPFVGINGMSSDKVTIVTR